MKQISLFEPARPESLVARRTAPAATLGVPDFPQPRVHAAAARAPVVPPPPVAVSPSIAPRPSGDEVRRALQCRGFHEFLRALDPLLTDEERAALAAAGALPNQLAHQLDAIVERLTFLWSELEGWPVFGRIREPRERLRPDLAAMSMELRAPSRGLAGQVAFRIEHRLRYVADPIPAKVLAAMHEHAGTFASYAFLEPIFSNPDRRGERRVLRTLGEVRREHCAPIDPLVVAWLGAGPPSYGLPLPRPLHQRSPGRRHSRLGELVFLIGHWD